MADQTITLQPGDTLEITVASAAPPAPTPAPSPAPDLAALQTDVDLAIADVFTAFQAPATDVPPVTTEAPADPGTAPAFSPNT